MTTHTPAYEYQLAHINEDKGPRTIAASGILIFITTFAVMLRLIAQRIVKSKPTADDICAILALVSAQSFLSSTADSSDSHALGLLHRPLWGSYRM